MTKRFGLAAMLLVTLLAAGAARSQESETDTWHKVRDAQFAGRSFEQGSDQVVALEAPVRAEDAAVVPILIHAVQPQQPDRWIRKIYLVIDKNPSPMGAVFTLSPESGRADIETRIRIEDYTWVRAIAEMQDGKLYMAMRYVKAAGGCSATSWSIRSKLEPRSAWLWRCAAACMRPACFRRCTAIRWMTHARRR